jgi:hypothetical protein
VQGLPSTCQALGSIPSAAIKKKKKRKKEMKKEKGSF